MRRSPLVILFLSLVASTATLGAESPATTQPLQSQPAHTRPAPGPFARQLAIECDELIALAIKRPYGWAWHDPATDDADEPATKLPQSPSLPAASKNKTLTIAVAASARAGMILWLAGDILGEKRYHDAARNVARGIAATQTPSGKFPQQANFGPGVTAREPLGQFPERFSTHAALALLLNTLDNQSDTAEQLQRSTIRATTWLRKQQADSGAWPTLYPEGLPPHKQTRLARLDTPDFRDSTVAMLLAAEVLADPLCRRTAEKSLEFLDKTRAAANAPGGPATWGSAYTLSALAPAGLAEFPPGTDALATRHAIETSLWCYLVLGNGQNFIRAQKAARSLEELPHEQGWARRYTPQGDIYTPPAPATRPSATTRESDPQPPAPDEPRPDLGIQSLLRTVQELDQLRRDKALPRLASFLPLRQLLAVQAAGLNDGSIPLDFPASADQVSAYLAAHKAQFDRAGQPKPRQFSDQVVRLWPIYLRALLEAQRGA